MVRTYTGIAFLRALAAFWVLFAHCMIWGGWYGVPLPDPKIAVDLFMMLSGFVMVATGDARDAVEPLDSVANWRRFWLRRVFRLAPLYYTTLAIAIISRDPFTGGYAGLQTLNPTHWASAPAYDPANIHYTPMNVLVHVTFLSGLIPAYVDASYLPDWSLSLEMQFYAVFPGLLLIMRRFGFARSVLAIGIPVMLLGRFVAAHSAYPEPSVLIFKLHYFMAGMLACRALTLTRWPAARCLAVALVLVSLETAYGRQLPLLPLLLGTLVLLSHFESTGRMPGWLGALLSGRVVRVGSDLSYSVYMLHGLALSAAGLLIARSAWLLSLSPPWRVLWMLLFVSLSSYSAAFVTYHLIERPGIRLGSAVIRRVAPAVTKVATASTTQSAVRQLR